MAKKKHDLPLQSVFSTPELFLSLKAVACVLNKVVYKLLKYAVSDAFIQDISGNLSRVNF